MALERISAGLPVLMPQERPASTLNLKDKVYAILDFITLSNISEGVPVLMLQERPASTLNLKDKVYAILNLITLLNISDKLGGRMETIHGRFMQEFRV